MHTGQPIEPKARLFLGLKVHEPQKTRILHSAKDLSGLLEAISKRQQPFNGFFANLLKMLTYLMYTALFRRRLALERDLPFLR